MQAQASAHVPLQTEVASRSAAFPGPISLRVTVSTYNINSGKYFRTPNYEGLTVADWLDCYRENTTPVLLRHISFFFRKQAIEFINCGKAVYCRVARICWSDCSSANKYKLHGEYPFYFIHFGDQLEFMNTPRDRGAKADIGSPCGELHYRATATVCFMAAPLVTTKQFW